MGSDKKSDKRKRDSSPSSSLDEGKSKLIKTAEGRKEKKKSSSKNKESSSLKSHKHSSNHHSDKEKKSSDKHKDKRSKKDRHQKSEIQELTKEDYFSKNNEFATWLKEERKIYFSDLSTDSARELFLEFVKKWNKHKLKPQYYEGISTAPRSAHNWKIK
ncbi:unnamed protein product [Rhodiola kirilowii]